MRAGDEDPAIRGKRQGIGPVVARAEVDADEAVRRAVTAAIGAEAGVWRAVGHEARHHDVGAVAIDAVAGDHDSAVGGHRDTARHVVAIAQRHVDDAIGRAVLGLAEAGVEPAVGVEAEEEDVAARALGMVAGDDDLAVRLDGNRRCDIVALAQRDVHHAVGCTVRAAIGPEGPVERAVGIVPEHHDVLRAVRVAVADDDQLAVGRAGDRRRLVVAVAERGGDHAVGRAVIRPDPEQHVERAGALRIRREGGCRGHEGDRRCADEQPAPEQTETPGPEHAASRRQATDCFVYSPIARTFDGHWFHPPGLISGIAIPWRRHGERDE